MRWRSLAQAWRRCQPRAVAERAALLQARGGRPGIMRIAAATVIFGLALLWLGASASVSAAGDRHAGYYYPEPATREVYEARSGVLLRADRDIRATVPGECRHKAPAVVRVLTNGPSM